MSIKWANVRIVTVMAVLVMFCPVAGKLHAQMLRDKNPPVFDYVPDFSHEEIAQRLASLDNAIELTYNDKVKSFIDYFTVRDRSYTRGIIARKNLYFPIFEEYLAKHNMPDELKYLSVVESGLNPKAISRAGAGGLWQFMPATGRMYHLNIDWHVDDRMDPYVSTDAACKYLKSLYYQFNDWQLALAAYNTGPGNVRKAIKKSGGKKTFWEIYPFLPRETRSYVPQFIAVVYALNYAEDHNLWAEPEHPIAHDTILVNSYLHLETFARQLNLCPDDLLKLNPNIKRGAVPDSRINFALKVPKDSKPLIIQNRIALFDSASKVGKQESIQLATSSHGTTSGREMTVYRVKSGDALGKIASKHGVKVSDLQTWNKISGNTIYIGQKLNIWVTQTHAPLSTVARSAVSAVKSPTQDTQYYKVQSGDTLWAISKRYPNISIEELKKLNNLTNSNIKVGQMLLVSQN